MMNKTSQELKGLQSRLTRAKADVVLLKQAFTCAQREFSLKSKEVETLELKINELQSATDEPIVSEHAVLRWLERVEGMDINAIRARILDAKTVSAIQFAKSGKVKKDGYTLIFKNSVIVTVEI